MNYEDLYTGTYQTGSQRGRSQVVVILIVNLATKKAETHSRKHIGYSAEKKRRCDTVGRNPALPGMYVRQNHANRGIHYHP